MNISIKIDHAMAISDSELLALSGIEGGLPECHYVDFLNYDYICLLFIFKLISSPLIIN